MKTFIVPQSTQKNYSVTQLANRHWFCVVCTLIDSDIRLHSGQNDVELRGAITILTSNETILSVLYQDRDTREALSVLLTTTANWRH